MQMAVVYDIALVSRYADIRYPEADDSPVERWVLLAQQGDFAAFEKLVQFHRNDVFRLAFHYVRNREEAWDVSQEVFIKAFRALASFRREANFKTWLLRITANLCKDHAKKRRLLTVSFDSRRQADAAAVTPGPCQALEAQELGQAIQKALDCLSHKHKTAFMLREFEGCSYEEMAQIMNCSVGTVMSRLHHARKKLQESLQEMGVRRDGLDE